MKPGKMRKGFLLGGAATTVGLGWLELDVD